MVVRLLWGNGGLFWFLVAILKHQNRDRVRERFRVGPWIAMKANSVSEPLLERAGRWVIKKEGSKQIIKKNIPNTN